MLKIQFRTLELANISFNCQIWSLKSSQNVQFQTSHGPLAFQFLVVKSGHIQAVSDSEAKSILGVTLRNKFTEVFTSFEFAKSVSVVGGKNLHGKFNLMTGKDLISNPAAAFCSFDCETTFYLTNLKIILAVIK